MWPVILIAAATAAAQKYQADKARGENAARLKKMEQEFKALVPPDYAGSIDDLPANIIKKIPQPSYDMSDLTPEQYKLVGQYKPEVAPLIAEQRPDLVKDTAAGQEGKQAQIDALRRLAGISQQENDPRLAQAMSQASRRAQTDAQSRRRSIEESFARRGQLNSGLSMAAQLSGGAQDMEREAMAGQNAAAEAYRNRLEALRGSAQLGGQIRGQDLELETKNTGIMNDFNQRTSQARQQWESQRAGLANQAQLRNLDAQQGIANQNVGLRNQSAQQNRTRRDDLTTKNYQNQVADRAYGDNRLDAYNRLQQNKYGDQLGKIQGAHGYDKMGMDMNNEKAQANNQTIQGVGNAAAAGYGSYQSGQTQENAQRRADNRSFYEKNGRWMTPEEQDDMYNQTAYKPASRATAYNGSGYNRGDT